MTALRSFLPDPTYYDRYLVTVQYDRFDPEAGKHNYRVHAIGGTSAEEIALDKARTEGWEAAVLLRTARVCEGCGAGAWHEAHKGRCRHAWMNEREVMECPCVVREWPEGDDTQLRLAGGGR